MASIEDKARLLGIAPIRDENGYIISDYYDTVCFVLKEGTNVFNEPSIRVKDTAYFCGDTKPISKSIGTFIKCNNIVVDNKEIFGALNTLRLTEDNISIIANNIHIRVDMITTDIYDMLKMQISKSIKSNVPIYNIDINNIDREAIYEYMVQYLNNHIIKAVSSIERLYLIYLVYKLTDDKIYIRVIEDYYKKLLKHKGIRKLKPNIKTENLFMFREVTDSILEDMGVEIK